MKLLKFRIQHYKSIKDSSWCWLASDLTTLAGKNESGKTAILEALRDFDADIKKIPDGAIPLDDSGKPQIELCFKIDKTELDEISEDLEEPLDKEVKDYITKNGLTIIKNYEYGEEYYLDEEITEVVNKKRNSENQKHIKAILAVIEKLKKYEPFSGLADPDLNGDIEAVQTAISTFVGQVNAQLSPLPDGEIRQKTTEMVQAINEELKGIQTDDFSDIFLKVVEQYIPNFIFFSSFEHDLPFEIELAVAKDNEAVRDFAAIANLDLEKLTILTAIQAKKNLLNKHSALIAGDFKDCWKQGEIVLSADIDGTKLILGAKEEGRTEIFKIDQRSKGFQWFLSFYLRMRAKTKENAENIILIDEPGLYLHAKAQQDVMRVLEEISENSQVIFTTHSPYLIDAEKLYRVRLILKEGNRSRIEGKIHKGAGTETLTPIITAIGLDLTQDFSIAKRRNVLLEGISDYYFLQALKEFLPKSRVDDANFIPCVGAQKIPQLISLLMGWDLEFATVLDNDSEGKKIARDLSEKLAVADYKIIPISSQDGSSIEDLFSHDDFNSVILDEEKNDDPNLSNSKFLKNKRLDKVLLAKNFLEKAKRTDKSQIRLSPTTLNAFKDIFDKISASFNRD